MSLSCLVACLSFLCLCLCLSFYWGCYGEVCVHNTFHMMRNTRNLICTFFMCFAWDLTFLPPYFMIPIPETHLGSLRKLSKHYHYYLQRSDCADVRLHQRPPKLDGIAKLRLFLFLCHHLHSFRFKTWMKFIALKKSSA